MGFLEDDDKISTEEVKQAVDMIQKNKKPHEPIEDKIRRVIREKDGKLSKGQQRRDNKEFPHKNEDVMSEERGSIVKVHKNIGPMGYASVGIVIAAVVGWNAGNEAIRNEIQNELRVEKYRITELEKKVEKLENKVDVLGKAVVK